MSVPPWQAAGAQYIPTLERTGALHALPRLLLSRVAYQESSWRPAVIDYSEASSEGALGMFQLEPGVFPQVLDRRGWEADAVTAATELQRLYQHFRDWEDVIASYNWGQGNVQRWNAEGGDFAALPLETRNYLTDVFADVPLGSLI